MELAPSTFESWIHPWSKDNDSGSHHEVEEDEEQATDCDDHGSFHNHVIAGLLHVPSLLMLRVVRVPVDHYVRIL